MNNTLTTLGTLLGGLGGRTGDSGKELLGRIAPGNSLDSESLALVMGELAIRGEDIPLEVSEKREEGLACAKRALVSAVVGLDPGSRHLPPRIAPAYEALLEPSGELKNRVGLDDPVVMEALREALGRLELQGVEELDGKWLISALCEAYAREYPNDGKKPTAAGRLRECVKACLAIADDDERRCEALCLFLMAALVGPEGVELCRRNGDARGMGHYTTMGTLIREIRYHFWDGRDDGEDTSQMYRYLTGLWRRNNSQVSRMLNLAPKDGWRWDAGDRLGQKWKLESNKKHDVVDIARDAVDSGRVSGPLAAEFLGMLTKTGRLNYKKYDYRHPTILEVVYRALDYERNAGRDFYLMELVDTVREAISAVGADGDEVAAVRELLDESGLADDGCSERAPEVLDVMRALLVRFGGRRTDDRDLVSIINGYIKKKKVIGKVAKDFRALLEEDGTLKEGKSPYDSAVAEAAYVALDYELNKVKRHAPWMPTGLLVCGSEPFLEPVYQAYAREYAQTAEEMGERVREIRSAVVECSTQDDAYSRACAIMRTIVMAALFGPDGVTCCRFRMSTAQGHARGARSVTVGVALRQLYEVGGAFALGFEREYGVDEAVRIGRGLEGPHAFSPITLDGGYPSAVGRHHADLVPSAERDGSISWYLCPRDTEYGTAIRRVGSSPRAVRDGERARLIPGDEIWLAPRVLGDAMVQDYLQGAVLLFEELHSYWRRRGDAVVGADVDSGDESVEAVEGLPKTLRSETERLVEDDERDPSDAVGFSLVLEGSPKARVFVYDELPLHHELGMDWEGVSIGRDKEGVDVPVGLYNPNAAVSRQHGRIMHAGGVVRYEDHSLNGSRVVREDDPRNPQSRSIRGGTIELRNKDVICLPDAHTPDVRIRFNYLYDHLAVSEYYE
ncbi:MAG: FHA domain-containing protein [Coriobacteriales bacterium]|nr:FHA domain-containing protein [Coriobacteriales bacterium]